MQSYEQLIAAVKTLPVADRIPFADMLLRYLDKEGVPIGQGAAELREFAMDELEMTLRALPEQTAFADKKDLMDYSGCMSDLIFRLYGRSWNRVPEEIHDRLDAVDAALEEACPVEMTVDRIFAQETIAAGYIDRLLSFARASDSEYEKSTFYFAMLDYRRRMTEIPESGRRAIADYLANELERYLETADPDDDTLTCMEGCVDLCRYFGSPRITALLYRVQKTVNDTPILFYTAESLLAMKETLPPDAVRHLAGTPDYAGETYWLLKRNGLASLFPPEYAAPEHLAESDLVRWLSHPSALGEFPEKVEYLGTVRRFLRRDVYHVFRFRTDSVNLRSDLRGKWLIGWADEEAKDVYSGFEDYALYQKETKEKTLKIIHRKLIGF